MDKQRSQFKEEGFTLLPQVIPDELLSRLSARMDALIAGEYETGVEPSRSGSASDSKDKIIKIDKPQVADNTILELCSHAGLGEAIADVFEAEMVQAWAVQLLYKPPGGQDAGNVGWHQDYQYWSSYWEPGSEVFTAWIAIAEVREDMGPMRFLSGSHHWGFLDRGDFFSTDLEQQMDAIRAEDRGPINDVPAVLPAGGVSVHHCLTYHGSGPNQSDQPRRSIAIHMRTEKSTPRPECDSHYVTELSDPDVCPILYHRGGGRQNDWETK